MAASNPPEIIVEELPGGGKRWRLANPPVDEQPPSENTFKHKIGSGHNLICLFELFVAAWVNHCDEMEDGSLRIPNRESATELHGLCIEVDRRISRELMRIFRRQGWIYYEKLGGEDRQILNACFVMSKGLRLLELHAHPFIEGTMLPPDARKEFVRAVRILALWFSAEEDRAVPELESTAHGETKGTPAAAGESGGQGLPPALSPSLSTVALRAYQQYKRAESESPHESHEMTDDKAYAWVKENEGVDAFLPTPGTWKRNLRTARAFYGEQKHRRRSPTQTRSMIGVEQIEARDDPQTG